MGWDTAERPHQACSGGGGGGGSRGSVGWDRGSAYPDWTAQVEKTPGIEFDKTQRGSRPSLMIDEEVRGWCSPPTSAAKGQGWGRHHSLSGLEDEGGCG